MTCNEPAPAPHQPAHPCDASLLPQRKTYFDSFQPDKWIVNTTATTMASSRSRSTKMFESLPSSMPFPNAAQPAPPKR